MSAQPDLSLDQHEGLQEFRRIVEHLDEIGPDAAEFFESCPALLCSVTRDEFVVTNGRWEAVLGWTKDELEGSSWMDLVHEKDRERTQAACRRLEGGGSGLGHFTNRIRRKDGSYVWLSWTASPWTSEGLSYCVVFDASEDVADDHGMLEFLPPFERRSDGERVACPGWKNVATLFRDDGVSIALARMEDGTIVPLHAHREKEVLGVYAGELQLSAHDGTELRICKPGDVAEILPGEAHWAQSVGTTLLWVVLMPGSDDMPPPPKEVIEHLVQFYESKGAAREGS